IHVSLTLSRFREKGCGLRGRGLKHGLPRSATTKEVRGLPGPLRVFLSLNGGTCPDCAVRKGHPTSASLQKGGGSSEFVVLLTYALDDNLSPQTVASEAGLRHPEHPPTVGGDYMSRFDFVK